MLESEKEYECQNNRCRCRFKVKADIEQGGIMELPVCIGIILFTCRQNVLRMEPPASVNQPFSSRSRYEYEYEYDG